MGGGLKPPRFDGEKDLSVRAKLAGMEITLSDSNGEILTADTKGVEEQIRLLYIVSVFRQVIFTQLSNVSVVAYSILKIESFSYNPPHTVLPLTIPSDFLLLFTHPEIQFWY